MNKLAIAMTWALVAAARAAPFDPEKLLQTQFRPEPLQSQTAHLAAELLDRYHYKPIPLDDALSVKIFDNYLKSLDAEKLTFLQTDIDRMDGIRTRLDDAIRNESLNVPFAIFEFHAQRLSVRMAYARGLLREGFDFSQREDRQAVREGESWAKTEEDLRDRWRKRVKSEWLNLKLAGRSDKDIVRILDKRYDNASQRIGRLGSEDAFQAFMNAYTMSIAPHTSFRGPRAADDIGISTKLSLVGTDTAPTENPDDRHARKSVVPVADGNATGRIGVISLPGFYGGLEARQKGDRDYRSAARDVARLLAELQEDKVDSVLIDLRNNGGGSLAEAIELTGLFVGQGPVVQQSDAGGTVTVERDTRASIAWSGPLGVLINRRSASASEIFAAAIQDYGRGLVIGETSYGKGTVQAIFRLDQIGRNDQPKFGELKLTVAQFFRVTGDSTQLRGVQPDIPLPGTSDAERFGESSFDNALPWLQIKAAEFAPMGDMKALLPILLTRHEARVKNELAAESSREAAKDILLNEAVRILADEVDLAKLSPGRRTVSAQAVH